MTSVQLVSPKRKRKRQLAPSPLCRHRGGERMGMGDAASGGAGLKETALEQRVFRAFSRQKHVPGITGLYQWKVLVP